jgi:hypothetical protein
MGIGEILYLWRNKALKIRFFFISMHSNSFPFNSHSCHPKFVRMQQKIDFYTVYCSA